MVCVERPDADSAALAGDADVNCDQFCPRQMAPGQNEAGQNAPGQDASRQDPQAADTDCLLFPDGSLLVLVSGVAVVPIPPPIHFASATRPFELADDYLYFAPVLAQRTPPPKA